MLLKIREVTAGKFSYFIIAIISVPFALWGINYYFQGGDGPVVIKVGSTEINLGRYNEAFNQRKRALEASLESSQVPSDDNIQRDVIGSFVRNELLKQNAEKYRYQMPDAAVAAAIMKMPEFSNEGKFDKQQYFNLLNANQQSQSAFEGNIREQLRNNQLRQIINRSSFVLASEQDRYDKFLSQERRARYVEFPVAYFIDPGSVLSTETRAYYEGHTEEFMEPDGFYLRYIELKMEDIIADLNVEEDDVRAYYDDNLDLFSVPEQRTVAHILIDPDRHEAAAERAQEVYAKLEQGESFAGLAKAYSDDSLTADKGGELLPLAREDLDGAAGEVIFALASGEFSEPVSSDFGLQIFKLISVNSSALKTFEEVRGVVEDEFRREEAEKIYDDNLEQIRSLVYEHNDNLTLAVEQVEALKEVRKTGLIKADEAKGIFQYPAVIEAAYTEAVQNQLNSPVLEIGPGHAIVIRGGGGHKGAYRPGKQKPFKRVEQEITEALLQDRAWEKAARETHKEMRKLEESDLTMDRLAEKYSFPLHDTGFIRRGGLPQKPVIEQAAFLVLESVTSRLEIKMHAAESYAIVEFVAARQVEIADESDEASKELLFEVGEFDAVLLGLLEEKSVVVHQEHFGDKTLQ